MRILVIGGNGFIGAPLVRQLADAGHLLAVLHRGSSAPDLRMLTISGDRNRLPGEAIARFAPDVVIDMILSSGAQAEQLMQILRGIAQRVVAISSMDVYRACGVLHSTEPGPLEPLPLTEDSPVRQKLHLYSGEVLKGFKSIANWVDDDYDKIPVEHAVLSDPQLPGTVLRLPMVYGPGDHLHRFFPLLKRMDDRRPRILFSKEFAAWRGPRGFVDNVASAIALAATSPRAAGRIYNVAEEEAPSELEFAGRIANQVGWRGEFVVLSAERLPQHLRTPGNWAQHWVASSRRIRNELGYREMVDSATAIRLTVGWERAHPPAQISPQQFDYAAEDRAVAA